MTVTSNQKMSMFKFYRKTHLKIALIAFVPLILVNCSKLKEQAGLVKKAPNEFTVITKAPLVMPPDYSLRPPREGARPLREIKPQNQAQNALVGDKNKIGWSKKIPKIKDKNKEITRGDEAFLKRAGALKSNSEIRQILNQETSSLAEKDTSFADRLLFWNPKEKFGTTVDAKRESKRLREAQAAGKPVNSGRTPIIKRRKRGLLERVF